MLQGRSVEFDAIEYTDEPLDRATLREIVERLSGADPAELVRTGDRFDELGLDESRLGTPESIVELLHEHPRLMKLPVAVGRDTSVIARPPEAVLALLEPR